MKALFLGHFAASVAPRILAKVKTPLESSILDDESDAAHLAPLLAEAEIVVGHIWRAGFPPAPRLRLLQSVAAGLDLTRHRSGAKRSHHLQRVRPRAGDRRIRHHDDARSDPSPVRGRDGVPHGLVGREPAVWRRLAAWRSVGAHDRDHRREVAERAAGLKCHVLAANRSPVADPAPAETVYPLAELDRMLPHCDTVLIACALAPETKGLIDARRLALMKPGALLINVARAAIVDEDALYAALKDGHLGGAALDVWWQYPTANEPERRPSRRPFHELSNVLMTPQFFEQQRGDRRPALERGGGQSRSLRARGAASKRRVADLTENSNGFCGYHLRHFYASALIANRKDPKTIETLMGHEDIKTTLNVYGHLLKRVPAKTEPASGMLATLRTN
jgi:hypothetical protein